MTERELLAWSLLDAERRLQKARKYGHAQEARVQQDRLAALERAAARELQGRGAAN